MEKISTEGYVARARIYGLALCFLTLLFFSSVKLAVYHQADRDFAAAKVWQQETSGAQNVQHEDRRPVLLSLFSRLILFAAPLMVIGRLRREDQGSIRGLEQWLFPSLFLRPPPAA